MGITAEVIFQHRSTRGRVLKIGYVQKPGYRSCWLMEDVYDGVY